MIVCHETSEGDTAISYRPLVHALIDVPAGVAFTISNVKHIPGIAGALPQRNEAHRHKQANGRNIFRLSI